MAMNEDDEVPKSVRGKLSIYRKEDDVLIYEHVFIHTDPLDIRILKHHG